MVTLLKFLVWPMAKCLGGRTSLAQAEEPNFWFLDRGRSYRTARRLRRPGELCNNNQNFEQNAAPLLSHSCARAHGPTDRAASPKDELSAMADDQKAPAGIQEHERRSAVAGTMSQWCGHPIPPLQRRPQGPTQTPQWPNTRSANTRHSDSTRRHPKPTALETAFRPLSI